LTVTLFARFVGWSTLGFSMNGDLWNKNGRYVLKLIQLKYLKRK